MTQPLPDVPAPQGHYLPAVREGEVIVSAGMTPRVAGVMQHPGVVGVDVSSAQGAQAAALAAANAVAAVAEAAGGLDAIARVVRMTVYIRASADFADHSRIADAASDVLAAHLGDRGRAARSAIGVSSLPGGACVELELSCVRRAVE